MIHGAVLAQHGDARSIGLHDASDLDWKQEVWSHAVMGLQLQELYISPEIMTKGRWDALAEALLWSRQHAETLADVHRAFPATCTQELGRPYGWASWRAHMGFLGLRNPL